MLDCVHLVISVWFWAPGKERERLMAIILIININTNRSCRASTSIKGGIMGPALTGAGRGIQVLGMVDPGQPV